jgi:anti-sigma regulatory factor (Ser/Thr protein kinase)/serine/threonine protein phosphatase PrpC
MSLLLESEDVAWFRDELTAARGAAAALARRIGLDPQRAGQVALAVSELASNLDKHAVDGALLLRVVRTQQYAGLEVLAMDRGPGMFDVVDSMRDGVSSVGTLGIGLGAVLRLADTLDVDSQRGRGTVLLARFWAAEVARSGTGSLPPDLGEPPLAGLTRAITGEQVCGDAWSARQIGVAADEGGGAGEDGHGRESAAGRGAQAGASFASARSSHGVGTSSSSAGSRGADASDRAVLVMLCDGLGHGPMAAIAAQAAVSTFRESRVGTPAEVVTEIHRALRGTRGAALAVARINPVQGRIDMCGVGNVTTVVLDRDGRSTLLSVPGIVGHQMPSLRTFGRQFPPGSALVMHSDGLSNRWNADAMPGFPRHTPILMAAQLLREAGVRHDDASVVVARAPTAGAPW